jgi:hypothetical protein
MFFCSWMRVCAQRLAGLDRQGRSLLSAQPKELTFLSFPLWPFITSVTMNAPQSEMKEKESWNSVSGVTIHILYSLFLAGSAMTT